MYILIQLLGTPQYAAVVTDANACAILFETQDDAQKESDRRQHTIMVEIGDGNTVFTG
jgi:hypothetical protein